MNIFNLPQNERPFGIKSYTEILEEGLKYIEDRKQGKIKSLSLPWTGLNNAGVAGLEWGSMLTIGARPGSGKTMFVSQICILVFLLINAVFMVSAQSSENIQAK